MPQPRHRSSSNARRVSALERAHSDIGRDSDSTVPLTATSSEEYDPKAKPPSPGLPRQRQRQRGRARRLLRTFLPEAICLLLYALAAFAVCAALPRGSALVGAFFSMASAWGVTFAVGLPLMVLHAARLCVVLLSLAWESSPCWRREEAGEADDYQASGIYSEPGADAGGRTPVTLIGCDVLLGVALYVAMGVATTVSWSRCAPAEPFPGDPALLERGAKLEPEGANIEGLGNALRFPPSFKFGTATAAYQGEGGLNRSSWYAFERGDPPFENGCIQRSGRPCARAGMAANIWARHSRDREWIISVAPSWPPEPLFHRSSSMRTSIASRASTCRLIACNFRGVGCTPPVAPVPSLLTWRRSSGIEAF